MHQGKRILVTGACGTVGSELVRQLLEEDFRPAEVVALDNNESELFFLNSAFFTIPTRIFSGRHPRQG